MRAVAFANNDMAIMAWTFGGKLPDCLGFAIYRIDVHAGTETCLPAMADFSGQDSGDAKRTTADAPVQKFYWKDVAALRGGLYKYRIVPMTGEPGALKPMALGALTTNAVELTPHYGALSAYFNRGILATQSTARKLDAEPGGGSRLEKLKAHIVAIGDPLRHDLEGQLNEALTTLSDQALAEGGEVFCALYEFQDPEAIEHLAALKGEAHLILSNMPGGGGGEARTNDTYAAEREAIRADGVDTIDRFMPGGHIGHNKFEVLVENGAAKAVLFGSTNWTSNALCAQTNNAIVAHSPAVAAAYLDYWNRLKADTDPPAEDGHAQQSAALRTANAKKLAPIGLEDQSGTAQIWFSPNTPHARDRKKSNEAAPPDLAEVFDVIAKAQQAILFLAFEPGEPSIVEAIAQAQKAKPSLFVRGAVTAANSAGDFQIAISQDGDAPPPKRQKGDAPTPEDFRVIHTRGVTKSDAFGQWEEELNQAGHAVIHDKIVVIDPFADNCVVVTGSHNLGYQASYNNDENLAIIRNHRAVAEAYAAHCLDIYDHYVWRYYLQTEGDKAWHFLSSDDKWQDSYFSPDNQVKSAELAFWLGATPHGDALPTPNVDASTRTRPALERHVRGEAHKPAAKPARAAKRGAVKRSAKKK